MLGPGAVVQLAALPFDVASVGNRVLARKRRALVHRANETLMDTGACETLLARQYVTR